jgi:bacillopeptidase F
VEGIGTIALDSSEYTIPSRVTVEVADSDLAGSGQTTVQFFSDTATEGQTVTLTETARPGLFRGFITMVSPTNSVQPGELRAQNGDTIWAEYFDASANGIARADASVDIVPATISDVSSEADYQDALVEWSTSKRTDSLVQFGESKFLGRTAYSPLQQTEHSLSITGLEPDRTYYFQVTSRDAAGNVTIDDNGGNFYTFTTLKPFYAPFADGFDDNNTNWVVLDGEAGTSWQLGVPNNGLETEAHSPPNAWGSNLNGNNIDTGDTTLASPAIDLSGGNRATLRFWHSYDFSPQSENDIYEVGQVYCTTNNGQTWDVIAEFDDVSDGWEEAEIDLTPYAGRVVHVGFYYGFFSLDNGNHPGWLIDDVSVSVSNSTAQFAFNSVTVTNGQAQLNFTAPAGSQYVIEASEDLINWTPLQTNTASGAQSTFTDVQAVDFPTRFYRLRK